MKRTDDLQLHSAFDLEKQLYALAEVFDAFHPVIKILPDHTIRVVDGTIVSYIFPDGFLRQFDHVIIEDVDAFAEYVPGESLQNFLDERHTRSAGCTISTCPKSAGRRDWALAQGRTKRPARPAWGTPSL